MTSNNKLIDYIQKIVMMTEDEAGQLSSCFKKVKIKKRQFIIQPNFTTKYRNFIIKGSMKAYVIGSNGEEHTILLGIEDWWITDYNSYIYQQPATMFVAALEDSTILQLDFEKEQELEKALKIMEEYQNENKK